MSDIVIREYNKDLIGLCLGSDAGAIFRSDESGTGQMSLVGTPDSVNSNNNENSFQSVVPTNSDTNDNLGGQAFRRLGSIMNENNNLDGYLKGILSDGKRLSKVVSNRPICY